MIAGAPLELPRDAFGPCFEVKTLQLPAFDRGWDSEATRAAGLVVTGLRDDTPAYRAGLRNGMKIVEIMAGRPGDSTKPYLMKVQAPGGPEQLVTFIPAGKARISQQKVESLPGCTA